MSEYLCEHGKLKTTCPECKPEPKPQEPEDRREAALEKLSDDWDWTWHAYRLECHRRIRELIERVHEIGWREDLYFEIYDEPDPSRFQRSEREDPTTFRGAFWLAFVKMNDLSVHGERIQGYAGAGDWDSLMYHTAEMGPDDFQQALDEGTVQIHGGNGTWSNQQRAAHVYDDEAFRDVIMHLCVGREGRAVDQLTDKEVLERLEATRSYGRERDLTPTFSLCSKLLQIFDPERWPVVNVRANAAVAERLGIEVPEPRSVETYMEYTRALRRYAREQDLPDLERLDILFSNQYKELQDRAGPGP